MMDPELTRPKYWKLMCFEHMRVLDMVDYWSTGTHKQYQAKLGAIPQFETYYSMSHRILRPQHFSFVLRLAQILVPCG